MVEVKVGEVSLAKVNRATSNCVDSFRCPLAASELIVPSFIHLVRMIIDLAVAAEQLSHKESVGMVTIATILSAANANSIIQLRWAV